MEKLLEMMRELEEAGIPSAYDHFAEGESPAPPFITYLIPGADNFAADGKAYFKVDEVHVELYTDAKDPELEDRVEGVLDSHEVYYSKSEVWIGSERLYEVMYSFQMKRDPADVPVDTAETADNTDEAAGAGTQDAQDDHEPETTGGTENEE